MLFILRFLPFNPAMDRFAQETAFFTPKSSLDFKMTASQTAVALQFPESQSSAKDRDKLCSLS